ncbi:poly(U)-specific 3'-to-5' RNA exonuclease [Xanthoria parietina]
MLATDQRQLFTESLPTAIEESGVKPFTMTADDLRWVANYEGNRWFLIVHVKKPPGDPMNKLLRASNRVAQNLKQPRLYVRQASSAAPVAMHKRHSPLKKHRGSQPSFSYSKGYVEGQDSRAYEDMSDHFHISIGWTLEDPRDHSGMDSMGIGSQGPMKLELVIETVKAKIGNAIVVVPLGSKAAETNGIVGL